MNTTVRKMMNYSVIIIIFGLGIMITPSFASMPPNGCPEGTIAEVRGLDVFCVTEKTSQKSVASQTNSQRTDDQGGYIITGVIIFIIIIAIIIKASQGKTISESIEYKDTQRKGFSYQMKERIKEKQNGKCKKCGRFPTHWEFDHINGRGDNSIDNCQGLCRDCHQDKTLKDNW